MGSFWTTSDPSQPWRGVDISFYAKTCKDIFNLEISDAAISWTFDLHYGLSSPSLPANLIVNGVWDGGWPYALQSSPNPHISVINVKNVSHCAWWQENSQLPVLANATRMILDQIRAWLL